MSQSLEAPTAPLSDAFVDRRNTQTDLSFPNAERRQFANSHSDLNYKILPRSPSTNPKHCVSLYQAPVKS